MNILILGIGNILMSDDGVGVRAIELLSRRYRFPDNVTLLDGGTLGLGLLPHIEEADRVLIIDAIETGRAPGTLICLFGEEIPVAFQSKLSPHQLGLKDLFAAASLLGRTSENTLLIGVQPNSIEMSLDLSEPVQRRLHALIDKVLRALSDWGVSAAPL